MIDHKPLTPFDGNVLILGFGSIGQGVLPLILRHLVSDPGRIRIVTSDDRGIEVANEYGVLHVTKTLTRDNLGQIVRRHLKPGDFMVNLTVDVASVALIGLCQDIGALYIDTCIEPWDGQYADPSFTPSQRSNYALREEARGLKATYPGGKTAVIAHGANPGMVSHFVKQAALNLAADLGESSAVPADKAGWAALMQRLGVKTIHIAERDTQYAAKPKEIGEFVNTWSIDGFVGEGVQPAELGWGTHEMGLPADGARHGFGCDAAIYLNRPGASTRVRTWTPMEGPFIGFLITHNEAISIADYFTVREGDTVSYRPTVHYAYHPCDDAVLSVHELQGKNWQQQERQRLIVDEIVEGVDELGVLLLGHAKNAYWFGSRLSMAETRTLVPHNNATSLQVTAAVLAGMVWAIENPNAGVVEAEEMDHVRVMEVMVPYLGPVVGAYGDWSPLDKREALFPEDLDHDDPWQFKNIRVV